MKINEFQKKACETKVAQEAKARVGQAKLASLPAKGTPKYQRLIDDIGADLVAASIACEALGVSLQYVCEVVLEVSEHLATEDITNEYN